LRNIPRLNNENLLVGFDTSDDAAVYKLSSDKAIIQTLDFFTPVVNNPYEFGQIAAANALSDIYAMGGEPTLAMNIVGFPSCLNSNILEQILLGGADKVKEAGAILVGGHSVEDDEPKYGLSVTGEIHPEKIISNATAKSGDIIVLTKPLGVGILLTALKADLLDDEKINELTMNMKTLNKVAGKAMLKFPVSSGTDVTGFGLLGHLYEMAKGSKKSIEIDSSNIAIIEGTIEQAEIGIIPAAAYRNQEYLSEFVSFENVDISMQDVLFDPQTSGGLIISIPKEHLKALTVYLDQHLETKYSIIGEVIEEKEKAIYVK
jgi:selenide,water dikinase